jgi:hypothetical protein
VGDRAAWKNPDHFARKHPKFRLKGVPCITFLENQMVTKSLTEDQCFSEEFINALFE